MLKSARTKSKALKAFCLTLALNLVSPLSLYAKEATTTVTPSSSKYENLVIFGDSFMDQGNTCDPDNPILNKLAPLYSSNDGKFSNGKLFPELLAEKLGLPQPVRSLKGGLNYAYGDSTTTKFTRYNGIKNLGAQVKEFLQKNNNQAPPEYLYVMSSGSNDLMKHFIGSISNLALQKYKETQKLNIIVENIVDSVTLLKKQGAKKIIVFNIPPLQEAPILKAILNTEGSKAITDPSILDILDKLFKSHMPAEIAVEAEKVLSKNPKSKISQTVMLMLAPLFHKDISTLLKTTIERLNQILTKKIAEIDSEIVVLDIHALLTQKLLRAKNQADINSMFYEVDMFHPSQRSHELITTEALKFIQSSNPTNPQGNSKLLISNK